MYELKKMERYLRLNLLGRGPRLIKKNLPGRGLTKVEKHCSNVLILYSSLSVRDGFPHQYKKNPIYYIY